MTMFICKTKVVGSEWKCDRCGYSWDLDDKDIPKCKTRERVAKDDAIRAEDLRLAKSRKHIHYIRTQILGEDI